MANGFFNSGLTRILNQNIDVLNDTIKYALLNASYVFDRDGDEFLSDVNPNEVSGGGYTAGGTTLTTKTVTQDDANDRAKFDADDITAYNLASGASFTGTRFGIVYKDTGVAATSPLICLIDFNANKNAPLVITHDPNGIFAIGQCS